MLWSLEGCLTGNVGIDSLDVLDLQYEAELFDRCISFASDSNRAPFVSILSPNGTSQIFVGENVTLRGFASDPNGQDVSCGWASTIAADAIPPSGCEVDVTFATPGARTLTLTGTDPAGASSSNTVTVTVEPAPEVLVTIELTSDGEPFPALPNLGPNDTIALTGSASGGEAPYDFAWTVAYPTDASGAGGEIHVIGPGATRDWTPSETLGDLDECETDHSLLTLEATDTNGVTGSRSVLVLIGRFC